MDLWIRKWINWLQIWIDWIQNGLFEYKNWLFEYKRMFFIWFIHKVFSLNLFIFSFILFPNIYKNFRCRSSNWNSRVTSISHTLHLTTERKFFQLKFAYVNIFQYSTGTNGSRSELNLLDAFFFLHFSHLRFIGRLWLAREIQ